MNVISYSLGPNDSGIDTIKLRINGVEVDSTALAGSINYPENHFFAIGSADWTDDNEASFEGDIHEVLFYNAEVTGTRLEQVESYLNEKWGLF